MFEHVSNLSHRDRGVSPVIGVALLLAVLVVLSAVSAGMLLSLSEEREPAPAVTMSLEPENTGALHRLVHEHGDVLDGDTVEIRGVANSDTLAGKELSTGDRYRVVPTSTTVEVVWYGEHDTSYVVHTFTVPDDETVPEPDRRCPWVDTESNGGTDDVEINGEVVACEVETDKVIDVENGGVVIGDTRSDQKEVDADDAWFYGDVWVDNNLNIQNGTITGSVTSNDLVKVDNSTVGRSIDAVDTIEVVSGSSVGGDVVSDGGLVKVLSSDVDGSIATDGSVKLQNATVDGDVYVDDVDFDCTDSTIDGQECDAYSPRDPGDY